MKLSSGCVPYLPDPDVGLAVETYWDVLVGAVLVAAVLVAAVLLAAVLLAAVLLAAVLLAAVLLVAVLLAAVLVLGPTFEADWLCPYPEASHKPKRDLLGVVVTVVSSPRNYKKNMSTNLN